MVSWGLQKSRHQFNNLLLRLKTPSVNNHIINPRIIMQPASKVQFYRRVLPETCISFSSEEGKRIFTESLLSGYANVYFSLAEQFRTQDEPAYCGLSTLVMALNTLEVDPKRIWKGPWRWYHEDMLDCCFPLELVQQNGITLDQFICLASCNSLDLNVVRMNEENISIDDFRKVIEDICTGSGKLLICSYSRKGLGQTGDGHFSPIGAYYPKDDLILVMDVARYKYPPHWVKVTTLWESMKYLDKVTELPRGYIIMRKSVEMPLVVFRLSTTFRVTIATHDVSRSHMAIFLKSWRSFLNEDKSCGCESDSLVEVIRSALRALNEALSSLLEGESIFTTQFNTCCMSILHSEHVESATKLIAALEGADVYKVTDKWVKDFMLNNQGNLVKPQSETAAKAIPCSQNNCCRLKRVGKSYADSEEGKEKKSEDNDDSEAKKCDSKAEHFVTDSHYITMLLFSWPYEMEFGSPYTICLAKYIDEALQKCDEILVNEARQLRQQIHSLILMVNNTMSKSN